MLGQDVQLGNYTIEAEIGSGGMARLFRVRHAVLGTLHAMKVLDASFRERPEVRDRFLSEGRIAAKLDHPNVVRVTDTVSTPEAAGLVMEFIDGPNLEQYLRGLGRPATGSELRAILVPVLNAVGEAHRRGIIHRDIKPANILLQNGSSGLVPKVTDFGIAKITDPASGMGHKNDRTRADARMGTLSYMSPEQIKGAKDVTPRSDIFSLGATLFELATGRVAYDGESEYDIMHRIVQGAYAPIEQTPGVDPVVAAVIRRALRPDPAERFASCEEMRDALITVQGPGDAPSKAERRPPPSTTPSSSLPRPVPAGPPSSAPVAPYAPRANATRELAMTGGLVNLFAPGMGSLIGGRTVEGVLQAGIAFVGFLSLDSVGWFLLLGAWCWALATSLEIRKNAMLPR